MFRNPQDLLYMMAAEIFEFDAAWAVKSTKRGVPFSSAPTVGTNWVDTHRSSALLLIKYGVLLCCGQCWCWAEAGPDAAISIRELWLYLIFLNYLYLASYQPPVSSIFTQGPAGFSLLIPTTLHFIWRHFRQLYYYYVFKPQFRFVPLYSQTDISHCFGALCHSYLKA